MKKLMFVLFVIIVLVTGCNQGVVPTQAPVEPALPEEEPTQIPTPTEEPTDIPVPTDEPTATPTLEPTPTPTEEPTPEPLPDKCPVEGFPNPKPEDLVIDLGEGYPLITGVVNEGLNSVMHDFDASYHEIAMLKKNGGTFSFLMPSPGFIFIARMTKITVNDELWGDENSIAVSPKGKYIIPKGSKVEITTEGGLNVGEGLLTIFYLSGEPIGVDEILLPEMSSLSCGELWKMTLVNSSEQDISIPLKTGHRQVLVGYDNLSSIVYPWMELSADKIILGSFISDGDILNLKVGGSVELLVFDLYPYSQD